MVYAHEIAAVVDYSACNLGQFVTVRRLLGVWSPDDLTPPEREEDTARTEATTSESRGRLGSISRRGGRPTQGRPEKQY